MANKSLGLVGCILHFALVGMAYAWIAVFDYVSNKKGFLIEVIFLLIFSVVIGKAYLKLNLDKLLLKFEISGASKWDKTVLVTVVMIALCVVCFVMVTVAIYFFKGVKMEQGEFVRFTVLPILSLAHLAFGTGSYLAYQYFENYA